MKTSTPTHLLPYEFRTTGIPLTGADHFLLALDYESRHFFDASHLTQTVLRLGPGFDPERFRTYITPLYKNIPFFGASIRPKWGGTFGPPVYHRPQPPSSIPVYQHAPTSRVNLSQARGVPERFQQLLSSGPLDLRNDHLIRFDVMEKDGATDLAITWLNVLFDGYGINRFLSLLSSAPTPDAFMQRINWNEEVQSPLDPPALPERLQMENDWASTMKELSQPTPGSPAGPLSNTPKRIQYEITRFSHEHSQQLDERAREEAGIISPMLFYLALSLRAHHRLFVYRNDVPERYLVPVAVDLRPQSTINPVFRNHISFLWFHAAPSELCSRTELIDRLQEQKRDQMESNFPHKMAVSLENNRYLPSGINRRMMRWQTKGELCSFFFAYTGAFFDGVDQLFGGTFIDGFPAPGVPSSPGSSFIWSHVNDQLNLTHLFQKGAVSTAERNEMKQQIEREREE